MSTRLPKGAAAAILSFLVWTLLVGCDTVHRAAHPADSPSTAKTYPIRTVVTVGMVGDIVRQVGGEHLSITQLCGPGVDPHLYKPTRDDVQKLQSADVVFYCGLMLEGKMTDTLVKLAREKPVVPVTSGLDESRMLEPEDFAGHYDPHLWMDVSAWSECVNVVADALSEFDPAHAADYQTNAQSYRAQLADLHQYGLKTLGSIPEQSRVLVTSHDAFNYLGQAYGLEVQGVQGISTESEAGLQRVNDLVDLLVAKNVRAVFIETSVPRKSIDALIEGAKARGHDVGVGGELFSDAMGEKGTYEGTYVGMLDHNFTVIARALGGEAPEKGWQGKLAAHP